MKKLAFFVLAGLMLLAACATEPAPTSTPTKTPVPFTIVPAMVLGNTQTVAFATDDGYDGHDIKPEIPTPALGAQATRETTCVAKDDNGLIFIIVRSILENEGLKVENGVKNLACWFNHPSDALGNEWYTNEGLPTGVVELQLITDESGIPAINYCTGSCSVTSDPLWDGWHTSNTSVPEIWTLAQQINSLTVYSMPLAGAIDYLFFTR